MHGLAHLRRVVLRQGKPLRPLALPHPMCLSVRIRGFFVSVPRVTFHRSRCSFRYADCPGGPTRGRGALRHPLVSFRLGAVGLGVIRVPDSLGFLPGGAGLVTCLTYLQELHASDAVPTGWKCVGYRTRQNRAPFRVFSSLRPYPLSLF